MVETIESKKARIKAEEEAEKAEFWQSVKSLYIPLMLFLSCCIFAGGAFVLYNSESEKGVGWVLVTIAGIVSLSAFVCLFRFQNPYRAKGIIPNKSPEKVEDIDIT